MTSVKWIELFKLEFEARIQAFPVVYLPMGLCEPHGNITVLGLDLIKAEYLCETAALRWGGIVAPSSGYHIHETGYHAPWLAEVLGNVNPLMTSMPPFPVLYYFLYQLRSFYNTGFTNAVIVTGHAGGNEHDLRMVAKAFSDECDMKVHVFNDVELTNGKYKGDHAGKYEISQMLYIAPQLVKMQRLDEWKKGELPTRFAQGEDASEASIELGKEIMEECLSGIHQILDEQTFQSPKPVQRTPMVYEQIEAIWKAIREDSINWRTNKINANQKKILDNSIWQPFEKGMVTGL